MRIDIDENFGEVDVKSAYISGLDSFFSKGDSEILSSVKMELASYEAFLQKNKSEQKGADHGAHGIPQGENRQRNNDPTPSGRHPLDPRFTVGNGEVGTGHT